MKISRALTLAGVIGILFFSGCKTVKAEVSKNNQKAIYPSIFEIFGLPATKVKAHVLQAEIQKNNVLFLQLSEADPKYILENEEANLLEIKLSPWKEDIQIPAANYLEADSWGYDDGISSFIRFYNRTNTKQTLVACAGKNIKIYTELPGGHKIIVGTRLASEKNLAPFGFEWFNVRLVTKQGDTLSVEPGQSVFLPVGETQWKFTLISATYMDTDFTTPEKPGTNFSANFVMMDIQNIENSVN